MKKRAQTAKKRQPDKNCIGVTAKIFALLEYFIQEGAQQQAVSFQKLSSDLPFARTTVHRGLYSLEKFGYVEKAEAREYYCLGPKFLT